MYDILQIILWVTAIMVAVSGVDDLYMDLLYWILKGRYKSKFPDFSAMHYKAEKPIAILLGAWKESGVIGRTLSYAIRNQRYKNFRIFVGIYPNDPETINIVKEISLRDPRVIACINPQDGPTTKADNLNSLYAGLCEYEKVYGEFEIVIVHDAEDFIHPSALKLYNFLIGYKGYHGIQIPVVPIKSKLGKLFHRTYCDAFAEIHTKDMIVRQGMGTFIPFSGTGMGFHRRTLYFLEKSQFEKTNETIENQNLSVEEFTDNNGRIVELSEDYFNNNEDNTLAPLPYNDTSYQDDPFVSLNTEKSGYKRTTESVIKRFTATFMILLFAAIGFLVYEGNAENDSSSEGIKNDNGIIIQKVYASDKQSAGFLNEQSIKDNRSEFLEGYSDFKYNVLYVPIEGGKFGIQESLWGSPEAANDRLGMILNQPSLNYLNGYISKSVNNNKTDYKVIIGNYENLDEARKDAIKIRNIFNN